MRVDFEQMKTVFLTRILKGFLLVSLGLSGLIPMMPEPLSAQCSEKKVRVTYDVPYCQVQTPGKKKIQTLKFDFYEPADSSDSIRPLVITLFGGLFVFGTRQDESMLAWCTRFAENGYVAASIDYHLMPFSQLSSKGLIRTAYMAAQDVSAAVRFFKAHSEEYRIDTNKIFLLGQSSGAVAVMHALYLDEDERPKETFAKPALSPLHSIGTEESKAQNFSVAGAIMLWGCVINSDVIDEDEDTPICLIHGEKDKVLYLDSGRVFSMAFLPYTYGSRTVANRMQSYGNNSCELNLLPEGKHAYYYRSVLMMSKLEQDKFETCWQYAEAFLRRYLRKQD